MRKNQSARRNTAFSTGGCGCAGLFLVLALLSWIAGALTLSSGGFVLLLGALVSLYYWRNYGCSCHNGSGCR